MLRKISRKIKILFFNTHVWPIRHNTMKDDDDGAEKAEYMKICLCCKLGDVD